MTNIDRHYTRLVGALSKSQLVPFIGANINLCGRPENETGELETWLQGNHPPSNQELALLLNQESDYLYSKEVCCPLWDIKEIDGLPDECPVKQGTITRMPLEHVAQYLIDLRDDGEEILYGVLNEIKDATYRPNAFHNFFARIPAIMREKGYYPPYPVIVTTCFDRTLEHTFDNANQSYDLISFVGQQDGGIFAYTPPGEEPMAIEDPNMSVDFLAERPVILKFYGGYKEQYVVTEDNFIDYLTLQNMVQLLPISILDVLKNTDYIWFLGYSPSYWNQRVILYRIWKDHISGKSNQKWWAVQTRPEANDNALWKRYRSIHINVSSLGDYVSNINKRIDELSPKKSSIQILETKQGAKPMTVKRDQIFISYSHKDKAWLEEIQSRLKTAGLQNTISLWDDKKIIAGEKWENKIEVAIENAKAALLLVSNNYLASDFISTSELPLILNKAEKKGLRILWLCLDDCMYDYTDIKDYHALHDVSQPLENLAEPEQKAILKDICMKIMAIAKKDSTEKLEQ